MATLKTLLFSSILIATIILFVTTVGSEPCTGIASNFLTKLKEGNADSVISLFGENSCHCQPRGGYVAYLRYESGENDNLAFLFGHKFNTGKMSVKTVPTIEKIHGTYLPWEAPESTEVDIPISFDKAIYSPYFLPLDCAYGYTVKEADLEKFCQNPGIDFWKAGALRLRPTLTSGLVAAEAKAVPNRKPEFMADVFKELLPAEQAKYLKPTDAGQIIGTNGQSMPTAKFEKMLPRLKQGILRLYIGRRGRYQRWAVKKGRLKDPVFELANGKEERLMTPESSLVDIHGPAAEAHGPAAEAHVQTAATHGQAAEASKNQKPFSLH